MLWIMLVYLRQAALERGIRGVQIYQGICWEKAEVWMNSLSTVEAAQVFVQPE